MTYVKGLIWDDTMQSDRCYAYADREMINQISLAAGQGLFAPQAEAAFFHVGATRSFRETGLGEAPLQLTFYEEDGVLFDGIECVRVEATMTYYRDLGAHVLLEALPNSASGVTDPRTVYALRWMAGRRAGVQEFNPPYKIVS